MVLPNPFRSREQRLPVYERVRHHTKERYSDDDDEFSTTESDYDAYPRRSSAGSSRNTSGSVSSGMPMLSKRRPAPTTNATRPNAYPYRLPTKVTRYLCFAISGLLLLMILSLIRASQVENWKVANGQVENRPPPPPMWEKFPFLERYYGGIRTLKPFSESKPEYPRVGGSHMTPSETREKADNAAEGREVPKSQSWESYSGHVEEEGKQECFIDAGGRVSVPSVRYYNGRPQGFPRNVAGSYELLNLPEDICFERFGRYGPYGFGYSLTSGGLGTGENGESEGSAAVWSETAKVDYRKVDWADVQRRCYQSNAGRFKSLPSKTATPHGFFIQDPVSSAPDEVDQVAVGLDAREIADDSSVAAPATTPGAKADSDGGFSKSVKTVPDAEKKARTAVVIRCWDEYLFREDDIANIRSIIAELALASGGRYDVHLLVQVKNDAAHPVWADHEAYERRINETIPVEFRGLVTLWTETQMLSLYQGIHDHFARGPDLPVHGVYRGLSMAMQHFAYLHPEYEFFWQWEMDVRYTGHYYDFFTKVEKWAKEQPRKGLWERNARFYFPEVHGSWDEFSQLSRIQSEMGTVGADNLWHSVPGVNEDDLEREEKVKKSIWGPMRPKDDNDWFEPANDPTPPPSGDANRMQWGVGEEADYISFNPMFDPDGTTWGLKDDYTGFNRTGGGPPRRAHIITTSRMSRRLLMTMHKMTAYKKQFAFPEMWPATVALQHGYKAVYAPHPTYVDRRWPLEYMTQVYNGGRDGSSGGARTSIFGDREHNMHGLSWFYNSGFAPNLYRRWLGLKVNNDGGEEFEKTVDESKEGTGVGNMPGGEGRMCLPPMLLHPVKEVELPVEAPPEEQEGIPESDPAA